MHFSTVATVAAVAAVASAGNVTTSTATHKSTTLVTITSCEDHICSETVSPALVSTATVTVSDVITEYTTWCPLPTESSTVLPTTVAPNTTTTTHSTATGPTYTGGAAKALPAAGALFAGAAALLL